MTTMETTSTPTRVARYVPASALPGYGTDGAPIRVSEGARGIRGHAATIVLAVLPVADCPRCRDLMTLGSAAAAILLDSFGGDCVAPYTHSLPL